MSGRSRRAAEDAARRRRLIVIGSIVAVVVIAGIIAIVATGGGGGDGETKVATGSQNRPVTVTGTALPRFGGDADTAVGMTVPTIAGQSFNGGDVKVDPTNGRAKVLLGVAHWCPHCQREVPLLSDSIRSHPLPASVEMIAISTSVQSNAPNYPPQTWLEREHWPTPVLVDDTKNTAADAIGLSSFPYFVFTDGQGKVVARRAGEIPVEEFRQLVDQIAKTASPS